MKRVSFFIDGFNLYHSLIENSVTSKYKWLDLSKLCSRYIRKDESLCDIYYFTAIAEWNIDKKTRHEIYIRALIAKGVIVKRGHFNPKKRKITINRRLTLIQKTHEEKRSDVSLGVELVALAFEDKYDNAIIVSADGDMEPPISRVKTSCPGKEVEVIFPFNRSSQYLEGQRPILEK